jgi:hypothetical protein
LTAGRSITVIASTSTTLDVHHHVAGMRTRQLPDHRPLQSGQGGTVEAAGQAQASSYEDIPDALRAGR